MNRREALKSLMAMTASLLAPRVLGGEATTGPASQPLPRDLFGELLPQRTLGRTGAVVTILGVGGWHLSDKMDAAEAKKTIETAIAGGVRFFDTSMSYGNGRSETLLGKLLTPKYRDSVFLMTKTDAHDAATARKDLDDSLRRLNTDHLDLWQMHDIKDPQDAERRISQGVLDVLIEAQAKGKTRYIGFTGHTGPAGHRRMLELVKEHGDVLQTCQMPINLVDPGYSSFIHGVLPTLIERGYGVLAMKTLSNGNFFPRTPRDRQAQEPGLIPDRVSVADAINFVWSLPISVLITGPDNAAMLQEKIDLARQFQPVTDARRDELIAKAADMAGKKVEYYKA